jgi:hypothetical protein
MRDLLGDAPEAKPNTETDAPTSYFNNATALALTAFPLALLMLMGPAVFRGLTYTVAFAPGNGTIRGDGTNTATSFIVAGAVLSAAFSLLPLALARQGLRRTHVTDPAWTAGLLRAAVALGLLCLILRTVLAIVAAATVDGSAGSVINFVTSGS